MSRTLITGGAGFIGLHTARRLLADGHAVDLTDNFSRGVRDDELDALVDAGDVRIFDLDLLDPGAWDALADDYDVVFHFAAMLGVANVLRSSYDVLDRNIAMTTGAIAFARRQQALSRFVFASTSEVYAGTLLHHGLTFPTPESTPLTLPGVEQPRTTYMLSKIVGEALCHQSGLPFTILRPHNVYGPRMGLSHVIPELLHRAWKAEDGGVLEVYSADHRRTFCYVSDAVELLVRAAFAEAGAGATVNIGVEEPEVEIGQLAREIVSVVGRDLRLEELPATAGSPVRRAPDTSAVRAITGFTPEVSLREGVERTLAWYEPRVFAASGVSAT